MKCLNDNVFLILSMKWGFENWSENLSFDFDELPNNYSDL